jgi:hypothetical protein
MESGAMTIREHLGRRSRVMFNLTIAAAVASFLGFVQRWPLTVAVAWWTGSVVALIALIVVGARMARCPRCGSNFSPDADQCAGCGVNFGEPMGNRGVNLDQPKE